MVALFLGDQAKQGALKQLREHVQSVASALMVAYILPPFTTIQL